MSIRDRGLKKWHGFFMPEHTGELKNIWLEDQRIAMPILDEYQLQEFEESLRYAIDYKLHVDIEVYVDGFIENKHGFVQRLDQITKEISLKAFNGELTVIKFKEILKVKVEK
ncbi:YolD-like family protein [Bacillus marasmi]|uniref:YolD-like family protein n=1 Tax=Bacillus marasmi TaxID=1926279 RepID=UPI0011CBCB3E|nr:YolD-like family protein [Bacillus marasmi]